MNESKFIVVNVKNKIICININYIKCFAEGIIDGYTHIIMKDGIEYITNEPINEIVNRLHTI